MEEHIDNKILRIISNKFKNTTEIAEELKEDIVRVRKRMIKLKKDRYVTFFKSCKHSGMVAGAPYFYYKKSCTYEIE